VTKKATVRSKSSSAPAPKKALVAVRKAAQKPVHATRSDIQRAVRAVATKFRTAGA